MNRRDLLKSAIALPLLGFVPKAEASLNLKFEISKEDALKSWILGKCEELKIHPTDWQLTQLIRMFSENEFIEIEAGNSTRQFCGCSVGVGKSYLLAIYCVIFASSRLTPEPATIVVTGSSRKNANIVISHIVDILNKAHQKFEFTWGTTINHNVSYNSVKITAIEVDYNTGRGYRPNILLINGFNNMDKDTRDNLILGRSCLYCQPIRRMAGIQESDKFKTVICG